MNLKTIIKFIAIFFYMVSVIKVGLSQNERPTLKLQKDGKVENYYSYTKRLGGYYDSIRTVRNGNMKGTGYIKYMRDLHIMIPLVDGQNGDMSNIFKADSAYLSEFSKKRRIRNKTESANTEATWREVGPSDMPLASPVKNRIDARGIGRIESIYFDPNHDTRMFVTSPTGGLWKSTNGNSWTNCRTDYLLPMLGVSGITIADSIATNSQCDNDIWFITTGEGDGPVYSGPGWRYSFGVYRTKNAGATWEPIGLSPGKVYWSEYRLKKPLIDPTDCNRLYVVGTNYLFKTDSALATPVNDTVSWDTLVQGYFYDIEFDPDTSGTIYVSGVVDGSESAGIKDKNLIYSTNRGGTWSAIPGINDSLSSDTADRVAMEISNDTMIVHVTGGDYTKRLWRSPLNNWSWEGRTIFQSGSVANGRCQSVGVSPNSADSIFIADIDDIARISSWSGSWTKYSNIVHDDIHSIKWARDSATIWAATDGGMYKSINGGSTWTESNDGLGVQTNHHIAVSAQDSKHVMTGSYDDGSDYHHRDSSDWYHVLDGDGLNVLIDYSNDSIMFASYQEGGFDATYDRWATRENLPDIPLNKLDSGWATFFELNSQDHNIIYASSDDQVQKMDLSATSPVWVDNSNFHDSINHIWRLATAPSNGDYLYAIILGWSKRKYIFKSTVGGGTGVGDWVKISNFPYYNSSWLQDMVVDEHDPEIFWIVLTDYSYQNPVTKKVYKYNGHSDTWTDLSVGIPWYEGVQYIVHEHGTNGGIYVGTDRGSIYYRDDNNDSWVNFSDGLPNVQITDLVINYKDKLIFAGTFGRGMWYSSLYCPETESKTLSGTAVDSYEEVWDDISTTQLVNNNIEVIHRAGKEIIYNTGFEAKGGAYYHGFTKACTSCLLELNPCEPDVGPGGDPGQQKAVRDYKETIELSTTAKITPNPNKGVFSIEIIQNKEEKSNIYLYDMVGKLIYTNLNIKSEYTKLYVNMKQFSKGIYNLIVTTGDKVSTGKVVYN